MLPELIKNVSPSCVMITTPENGAMTFLCSGFLCGSRGYVISCAHALDISKKIYVSLSDYNTNGFRKIQNQRFNFLEAKIVQHDPINDVVILKVVDLISVTSPKPSEILKSEIDIPIGTSSVYLGYPFAARGVQMLKVSSTIVSAKILNENNTRQLVLDSTVNDGNSGGPLIEVETSKIIGIVSGRYAPAGSQPVAWVGSVPLGQDSNISFATGISYAIELLKAEKIYEH